MDHKKRDRLVSKVLSVIFKKPSFDNWVFYFIPGRKISLCLYKLVATDEKNESYEANGISGCL
ncbi:hypothetical protein GCM10028809_66910 [Spirosoma gilvum]